MQRGCRVLRGCTWGAGRSGGAKGVQGAQGPVQSRCALHSEGWLQGCWVHGGCRMGTGQAPETHISGGSSIRGVPSTSGRVTVGGTQRVPPPRLGAACCCVGAAVTAPRRWSRGKPQGGPATIQHGGALLRNLPSSHHTSLGARDTPQPHWRLGWSLQGWGGGHKCGIPSATPQTPAMTPSPICEGLDGSCSHTRDPPGLASSRHLGDRMGMWGERKYFCIIPLFLHDLMAKRRWGPRRWGYGNGTAPVGHAGVTSKLRQRLSLPPRLWFLQI